MSRLNILPDPRVEPLVAGIQARLNQIAGLVNADNFTDLLTPLATALLLDAFERVGAHEGTVWLADAANCCLIPAFNNGPNAAELRKIRQPLDKGITSMVFANEQPFVMNHDRSGMDPTVQERLKVRVTAQIIVPLYFLGECRGVAATNPRPPVSRPRRCGRSNAPPTRYALSSTWSVCPKPWVSPSDGRHASRRRTRHHRPPPSNPGRFAPLPDRG